MLCIIITIVPGIAQQLPTHKPITCARYIYPCPRRKRRLWPFRTSVDLLGPAASPGVSNIVILPVNYVHDMRPAGTTLQLSPCHVCHNLKQSKNQPKVKLRKKCSPHGSSCAPGPPLDTVSSCVRPRTAPYFHAIHTSANINHERPSTAIIGNAFLGHAPGHAPDSSLANTILTATFGMQQVGRNKTDGQAPYIVNTHTT